MKVLLLTHAAATLIMFGVILIVQVVHYPLFSQVGAAHYTTYQAQHMTRITWIVFPAMVAELVTAGLLVGWRPPAIPAWQAWVGLGLVGVIWASTAFVQVPIHSALTDGFDAEAHRRLVATNWIRTVAWGLRAGLVLYMLHPLLKTSGA